MEVPQTVPPKSGREHSRVHYSSPIKTFAATFQGPSLLLCNILAGSLQYGTLEHCQAPVFSFGWTTVGKGEGGSSFLWAPVRSKLGWNRRPRTGWEDRRPFHGGRQQGESDGWTRRGPEEPKSTRVSSKLKVLRSPDKTCCKLKWMSLKLGSPACVYFTLVRAPASFLPRRPRWGSRG